MIEAKGIDWSTAKRQMIYYYSISAQSMIPVFSIFRAL